MKHPYHSHVRRWVIAFILISVIMIIGTVGMHITEHMPWIDAFYFMSMLATAQGSAITPVTGSGKIFAALMAFLSVGVVVTSLGFVFGPFLGKLWHIGFQHMEREMEEHRKSEKKF